MAPMTSSSPPSPIRHATLYRMATPEHLCPFGLKSRALLRREGFTVDDHLLGSRAEVDAFMKKEGVEATPQTFIGAQRVGGYDDLRRHVGRPVHDAQAVSYAPVMAVFGVAALMALAAGWAADTLATPRTLQWFVAFSMCMLALLKLRDLALFIGAVGTASVAAATCRWASSRSPRT